MADADDLFDDDEMEDAGDEPEKEPNPEPESGDVSDKIKEVSDELAAMGVVVDPSKDADDFLHHLCTALRTHRATKDIHGKDDDDDDDDDAVSRTGDDQPSPEQPNMLMSLRRHKDPTVRMLAAREEARCLADRKSRISKLRKSGKISADLAKDLERDAATVGLSLGSDGVPQEAEFDRWLTRLEKGVMANGKMLMSARSVELEEEKPPLREEADVVSTIKEMAKMAGVAK